MTIDKNKLYGDMYTKLYETAPHRTIIQNATFSIQSKSPSCGDQVHFTGIITNGIIAQIGFMGNGSMLSHVFAELLCEHAEGQQVSAILNAPHDIIASLIVMPLGPNRLITLQFILKTLQDGIAPYA